MSHDAPQARTAAGAQGLAAIMSHPRDALIGLDFDGTLSPIVADPARAYAHPGAAPALRRLAPLVGTLAVITGRPAATAVELGGFADVAGLLVLGQYGLERWEDGALRTPDPVPGVAEARVKLPEILRNAPEGVAIEDKGHALAVHTRRAAEPQVAMERLRGIVAALAERTGPVLEPGRYVLELRPAGTDKGGALRALVAAREARSVLFAGDDLGDLPAYDAIETLRAEGVPGVKVCSASDEVAVLAQRADLIVAGPPGVVAFVRALADRLR